MGIAQTLAETTTRAAVSGLGFSFGRDAYRGIKKNVSGLIVLFLIIFITLMSIYGVFVAGLWMFRNYPDPATGFASRVKAILMLLFSICAGAFPFIAISILISLLIGFQGLMPSMANPPLWLLSLESWTERPTQILFGYIMEQAYVPADLSVFAGFSRELTIKWMLISTLFITGSVTGVLQRKDRQKYWDIEQHNQIFIEEIGVVEVDDGLFEDFKGNRYRLESKTRNRIELFVLGRRNKRAYFYLSDDGRINSWSDIVDLGSKAGDRI